MSRWGARALALLVVFLFLCARPPATWAENACGGGGKPRPDEGGIGGTGERPVAPDDDDSGIGGTGISANGDTGIVGTITGFGSICVGGVEIHYDARSPVEIDGEPAPATQLAVGQVVEVVARGTGDEVDAQQIAVRHVVAGPVTALDAAQGTLAVMGETVQLSAADGSAAHPVGSFVQVNGLRRADGRIDASLVTTSPDERAHLTGVVTRAADGRLVVGATDVVDVYAAGVGVGDEVRVTGRWTGNQLIATAIEARPRVPFDGRVNRVEIEGFASALSADRIRIGAYVFDASATKSEASVPPDTRVRVQASIRDHRAVLEKIAVVGDRPPRPELLDGERPRGGGDANGIPHLGVDPVDGRTEGTSRERPEAMPPQSLDGRPRAGAPDGVRPERAERPERPERPDPMQMPERPPRIERPLLPQRPAIPDLPPRIDRPDIPLRR